MKGFIMFPLIKILLLMTLSSSTAYDLDESYCVDLKHDFEQDIMCQNIKSNIKIAQFSPKNELKDDMIIEIPLKTLLENYQDLQCQKLFLKYYESDVCEPDHFIVDDYLARKKEVKKQCPQKYQRYVQLQECAVWYGDDYQPLLGGN